MLSAGLRLVESGPLRSVLSLPSATGARHAAAPPLLCFLHGFDEAAPMAIERALTTHGPLAPASLPHTRDRFVVVAPQLPRAGDVWHEFADAVGDVVDAARAAGSADPARCYLTGFSFGGNGVFDLALADPRRWAALWAVDPTRPPPHDPGLPVWLSVGQIARGRAPAFEQVLGLQPAPRAGDGTGDRLVLDEGLDHVGSAASAYADARIYAWLLARSGDGSSSRR